MLLSSPCRGHEYDEATPTSDLWDAVLTSGQPSKHSTALVLQSLTSFNSPNGAPTAGVTTLSLVPAYTSGLSMPNAPKPQTDTPGPEATLHAAPPSLARLYCRPKAVKHYRRELFRTRAVSRLQIRTNSAGYLQLHRAVDTHAPIARELSSTPLSSAVLHVDEANAKCRDQL